ncbi:MAG: nucleotide exchange factor GrpE [Bacteroidales bacterium]|nr:nucleotide exchange factor GrpE [Bacteroidales bacterium]
MENENNIDPTVENQEPQEKQTAETLDTDNMADATEAQPQETADNTESDEDAKKGIFTRRNRKEKAKIEELEKQLEQAQTDKAELNDRFLRLFSEFDNYKKRVNKEKLDLISTASEKVIVSLLPVLDDFERAIAANEKVEDTQAIKDGFVLIYNKLVQLLKRYDVEEIQAVGEVFDTDFHEAVTHFPTDKEEQKGKVIDVTEKGYKLKDKVIRYAKVVVGQ